MGGGDGVLVLEGLNICVCTFVRPEQDDIGKGDQCGIEGVLHWGVCSCAFMYIS